jgi:hypothetical protein
MHMRFRASEEQVLAIGALAVNASAPQGMGYLQYDSTRKFSGEDLRDHFGRWGLNLDYVGGRMVKLTINRVRGAEGVWEVSGAKPREDYQSWCEKYPTYRALIEAIGIEPATEESTCSP